MERRKLLKGFGAELVLTPADKGMPGAIARAEELAAKHEKFFIPQQFQNPANPAVHSRTTAEEIWNDTEGQVDIVVAGLGTTGTATGIAKALKPRRPGLQVIGVEPAGAAMLSEGTWEQHALPGTSPGFVPELYDPSLVDEIVLVDPEDEAYSTCRRLAREEGLLVGVSSGATAAAAIRIGSRPENVGKLIVAIFADSGQRYLSVDGLFA